MKERKKKKGSKTVQSEILSLRLAKKKEKKKMVDLFSETKITVSLH